MDFFQTSTLPDDVEDENLFETTVSKKTDLETLCRNDSKFLLIAKIGLLATGLLCSSFLFRVL